MSQIFRLLAGVFLLVTCVSWSHALEKWEDDYQRLSAPVKVTARGGVSVFSGPGPEFSETNRVEKPIAFIAHGFVETGGVRFYIQESDYDKWLDEQKNPVWIRVNGETELPPLPPRIFEGKGLELHSGEQVPMEVYEEFVQIQPETNWPIQTPIEPDLILPVKVASSKKNENGSWEATFTVYPNFDSNVWKLGFPEPSYNQFSDPNSRVMRKLISRPDRKETIVRGASQGDRFVGVLKPGIVFHGAFTGGKLLHLNAGDNWPPVVACSNVSAPLFQSDSAMKFRFGVSTLDGGHTVVEVVPDKVTGADYTQYNLISQFGPPFHDETGIPEWTMDEWAYEVFSDLSIWVVAPLMDGRGAAGMLELEGLGLGPSYEEEIKLLKTFINQRPPRLTEADGWKSILKNKLGIVPKAQQIEENENY